MTESLRGAVANVVDCDILVSKFELQSGYYAHFRTNTLGKGRTPPYSTLLLVE